MRIRHQKSCEKHSDQSEDRYLATIKRRHSLLLAVVLLWQCLHGPSCYFTEYNRSTTHFQPLLLQNFLQKRTKEMAELPNNHVRQNYHTDCEDGVNKQINLEFYAMYTYLSMVSLLPLKAACFYTRFFLFQANYFDRWDVALPGFAKFFKKSGDEEKEHAEKLMNFQVQRGGKVVLQDIKKPAKDDWEGPLQAMQAALQLERDVNQALLDLHKVADTHGDFQVP